MVIHNRAILLTTNHNVITRYNFNKTEREQAMSYAQQTYALNLDQAESLILAVGDNRTVLLQGHMGTGKSSLLTTLAAARPDHVPCYFDCTTKDLGDITIPNIAKLDDGTGYVTYLTNEELGAHNDKPIILMIDEFGKANPQSRMPCYV